MQGIRGNTVFGAVAHPVIADTFSKCGVWECGCVDKTEKETKI